MAVLLLQRDSYKDPTSGCVGAYLLMYVATYQSKPQIPLRHVVQTEYHLKPGLKQKNNKTYSIGGTTTATFFVL